MEKPEDDSSRLTTFGWMVAVAVYCIVQSLPWVFVMTQLAVMKEKGKPDQDGNVEIYGVGQRDVEQQ